MPVSCVHSAAALALLLSICTAAPAASQTISGADARQDRGCTGGRFQSEHLYCLDLEPTPDFRSSAGIVLLEPPSSPFTVAVARDGRHRYRLRMVLDGLPIDQFDSETSFVAWATTDLLEPIDRLGVVTNGEQVVGEIAANKFRILVTAEASPSTEVRNGPIILRGSSPSSRMQGHDIAFVAPIAETIAPAHAHHDANRWQMPPMHPAVTMPPGMHSLQPAVDPWMLQEADNIPVVQPRSLIRLSHGDSLDLHAALVRKTIAGRTFTMLGFNGQVPGPLIEVERSTTVTVRFTNKAPIPTTVHWHGLRLDNRFDGVPGITQPAVEPGDQFTYTIVFPDAGIYWYHPHHREDILQELGLYGNILVRDAETWDLSPVADEQIVMLDDLLLDGDGIVPFGDGSANYMLMGRFGNRTLVNGEPSYEYTAQVGSLVRYYLTNVSNTRTFNLVFDGARIKVVGSDVGLYNREVEVESIVIAPAERYVVDVLFDRPGTVTLSNQIQAIDHRSGVFFPEIDTLGRVMVIDEVTADLDYAALFNDMREHVRRAALDAYQDVVEGPPHHELWLTLETDSLPAIVQQIMRLDKTYFNPVEWSGTMPMMNWASTGREIKWLLRDKATNRENMDIDWSFRVGDVVKIRLVNDRDAFHAMQHPVHLHGQRFLVLEQDGFRKEHLVWKDTVLLPAGSTIDILLELSNPGRWMLHCHISEHLESGMKMVFQVDP